MCSHLGEGSAEEVPADDGVEDWNAHHVLGIMCVCVVGGTVCVIRGPPQRPCRLTCDTLRPMVFYLEDVGSNPGGCIILLLFYYLGRNSCV